MFAEIDDRREQVCQAHHETFRWIFKHGSETGFAEWLSSGDGSFWIQGKPASGKSTLMKFIAGERCLEELLKTWTGEIPLVVASFYFWATGSQLQRSLVGFYRALLYQILKADDHLCKIAFPDWRQKFSTTEPSISMLTAAMNKLLAPGMLSNNFFFMIDGLDEYERDSIGKAELAELIMNMTRSRRIKILVSSRPEAPFERAFRQHPMLRLETLTAPDIVTYVELRLWSEESRQIITSREQKSLDDIRDFIIKHAQGVFLWVALVLDIALDGIKNYEDPTTIRDRVMLLPKELDTLFTHILIQRIPQHYRTEAFRYLLIALEWQTCKHGPPLTSTIIALAQHASSYEKACSMMNASQAQIEAMLTDRQNRVRSRCQGLLECEEKPSVHVNFLHRSLYDYLTEDSKTMALLMSGAGDGFEACIAIMAGLAIAAIQTTAQMASQELDTYIEALFRFNTLAEQRTHRPQNELLGRFDRLAASKIGRCWTDALLPATPPPGRGLLALTVYWGAMLGPRQSIPMVGADEASELLYFAVPPCRELSSQNSRPMFNIAAARLMLQHGADPLHQRKSRQTPWHNVLERLSTIVDFDSAVEHPQGIAETLDLMILLAEHVTDRHRCRIEQVCVPKGREMKSYNAHKAGVELVLLRLCCYMTLVRDCYCRRAQGLTARVMSLLQSIGSPLEPNELNDA